MAVNEVKTYEVGFTTPIKNSEDPAGKWWNYYSADSADKAEQKFHREMEQSGIRVIDYQIREV